MWLQHKFPYGLMGRSLVLVSDEPASSTLQEGLLDCLRQGQENKSLRRIKVIFAALVHDPELSVRIDAFVRQYTVDLVQLQRSRVSINVDTDGESDVSYFLFHALSDQILLSLEPSCL